MKIENYKEGLQVASQVEGQMCFSLIVPQMSLKQMKKTDIFP